MESSPTDEFSEVSCFPITYATYQSFDASVNSTDTFPGDTSAQNNTTSNGFYEEIFQQPPDDNETITPSNDEEELKLYFRRWYILGLFGLFAFTQGGVWNTWSPISSTSKCVFGWTNATLSFLTSWGPISYLIATFFSAWLLDTKGLRPACILVSFLVSVGTGLRCITSAPVLATWLIHSGQFFNGLAGPVAVGAGPLLSSLWFPPYQRTTSTAVIAICNALGVGASFLLGPFVVPGDIYANTTFSNTTPNFDISTDMRLRGSSDNTPCNGTDTNKEAHHIMTLMYGEFGFALGVFILILAYFPNRPPTPPSISATKGRVSFKRGLIELLTNVKFWLIGCTYAVSLGVFSCWQGVLDVILEPHGISQNEAGWIGFYAVIGCCAGSLILARFADIFSRHTKVFLLILYITAAGVLVWFTLVCEGILPDSKPSFYISVVVAGFALYAACPLFYEISCEISYPVAEGITNLILTLLSNICGLIFLLVLMIPGIGTDWTNWCLIGCVAVCVPLIVTLKESYHRLDIDENVEHKVININ